MRHAYLLQSLIDACVPFRRPRAAVGERQLDVLEHGQIADQVETLKDEADVAIAYACPVGEVQSLYGVAGELIRPFGRW